MIDDTPYIKEAESRRIKHKRICELGQNPYPSHVRRDMQIFDATSKTGRKIWLVGKVVALRHHGGSGFTDIVDESGKIQLFIKSDIVGADKFSFYKNLIDVGDYLNVYGEIFVTKTGEHTVKVERLILLSKSLLPLPSKWSGLKDIDARYRKRYLDFLINPEAKKNIVLRANIISELRKFMEINGFIEVETPILQPIPGGAAAKPFVTRYNILDQDFYLRIAPELYLKRMIVGGFEKIFEIGRVFRNEGLSHMHNPEFTIFEFYWAYKNYTDLMDFTETMVSCVVNKIAGNTSLIYQGNKVNFQPPYKRITLAELILKDSAINIEKFRDVESLRIEIAKRGIVLEKDITVWPKMVDELYKKVSRPNIIEPIFVTDHPVELSPLAKTNEEDAKTAQRFQLVCGGGIELVNAYTELNDPLDQKTRFEEQAKLKNEGWDESQLVDENFIDALCYGMPPTAGWGMGVDRLVMLLTDNYSIKEIIPFPTQKKIQV